MRRLLLTRAALIIPTLLAVSMIIFGLASMVPGDAARTILGENATDTQVAALSQQLGLDEPFFQRYLSWLGDLLHGDLGTSIFTGEPVTQALNQRLSVTLTLVLACVLVCGVAGVLIGTLSAVYGGKVGRIVDILSLIGIALPSFWVAIILVTIFAVQLGWLPATGYVDPGHGIGPWIESLILPVLALSLLGTTAVAKQMRDAALDVLESDYIRVLRANGVPERKIIFKHLLRNSAIPVAAVLGVVAVGMLDGTVFVENVFVLPGLGGRATQGTIDHDLPIVMGIGVYFTIIVIGINLIVDIAYGLLNPKVRTS